MLKRLLIGLAVIAAVVCLAATIFVSSYEPPAYPRTAVRLEETPDGGRRWDVYHAPAPDADGEGPAWSSAHIRRGGAIYDSAGPNESEYDYVIVRGTINPVTGTFPIAVGCVCRDWDPLGSALLQVSSDEEWAHKENAFRTLATKSFETQGRWQIVLIEADAPIGTRGVQLVLDAGGLGDGTWSFGTSLPGSSDWRDRLYEALVSLPLLRNVPQDD